MKQTFRLAAALLSLSLLLTAVPAGIAAGDAPVPEGVTPVAILIDGQPFSGKNERGETVRPFAYDGTTYVPIRALGNALGYGVNWDSAKACVVVDTKGKPTALSTKTGGTEAPLPPGVSKIDKILINKQVFKGYNERGEKVAPFAYDGTTYVPIRALGLALKYEVGWDGKTSSVTVSTGGTAVPAPGETGAPSSGNTGAPVAGQIAGAIAAPTLDQGYDVSTKAGTWIPDLSAATGGIFYSDKPLNNDGNNMDSFHSDYPREEGEVVDVLREYCDAIRALPYFEVVEELNLKSGFYRCSFRYTGTGAVKTNALKSFSGDVCDFDIYLEDGERDIHLYYAQGLQVVDTGLRLTLSAEGSANFQVVGDHLTDAYQYQNGVYRNAGGQLSVKSGECALLVNGESCKGTVDFVTQYPNESNAADVFTVSAFRRSDWFQFAFPMNYAQAGDVYTVEKFLRQSYWDYGATDKFHQWGFAVSAQNGQDPVMPLDNDQNLFQGCNVRVLQWDKSGDTVVYFAAKLTLNGSPYTVEGLLAAPNRTEEAQPSGGSGGEGECWYCGGSGTCPTCGGSGKVRNWMPGTEHTFLEQNCTDCYRDGRCRHCGGSGRG